MPYRLTTEAEAKKTKTNESKAEEKCMSINRIAKLRERETIVKQYAHEIGQVCTNSFVSPGYLSSVHQKYQDTVNL